MKHMSYWISKLKDIFIFRRRGTIRTMFSVFTFALLLGAAVITSGDVSYIKLSSSQSVIEEGERFSLDVYAFAHVPVNAVDVTLRFEEGSVEVLSVDRGQSVLTIWTEDPVVEKDRVVLRGGTFRKGFVGEHKIATIELLAKKTGQSEFFTANVTLLAGDGRGTPVKVAESNNSSLDLYIYDENTDPGNIAVAVSVAIVTDIDGDGKVTVKDVTNFMVSWAKKDKVFDFNSDGKMTFRDFSIILSDAFTGL